MAAYTGRSVAFTWNAAAILGVREKGVALNGEPIDITSDESVGWRTLLDVSAQDEVTVSLSGVTKDRTLKVDWHAKTRTRQVVLTYPNGDTLSGQFYLSSYKEGTPYNEAITFEAELVSTGPVTYVAGVL